MGHSSLELAKRVTYEAVILVTSYYCRELYRQHTSRLSHYTFGLTHMMYMYMFLVALALHGRGAERGDSNFDDSCLCQQMDDVQFWFVPYQPCNDSLLIQSRMLSNMTFCVDRSRSPVNLMVCRHVQYEIFRSS